LDLARDFKLFLEYEQAMLIGERAVGGPYPRRLARPRGHAASRNVNQPASGAGLSLSTKMMSDVDASATIPSTAVRHAQIAIAQTLGAA
jgi:hypothetical protein